MSCVNCIIKAICMFYKLQEQFNLLLKLIFTLIKPKIATCKLNCSLPKDIFSFINRTYHSCQGDVHFVTIYS